MVGSLTAGCPQLLRTLINGCTSVDGNEVSLVNNASLNRQGQIQKKHLPQML